MASSDDVTFLVENVNDTERSLRAALTELAPSGDIPALVSSLANPRPWKRRKKVTVKNRHGYERAFVRTFSAAIPGTALLVWARVASDAFNEYQWVKFYATDPGQLTADRMRLDPKVVARIARILDCDSDVKENADGPLLEGKDFAIYDPSFADDDPQPGPLDMLRVHRAALLELLSVDEDLVWDEVASYVADRVDSEEPLSESVLDARECWSFTDGLGPQMQVPEPGDGDTVDAAGRWMDTWIAQFADSSYLDCAYGTAYGLEVSTWMFGDTESATVLVARDPVTGAIGGAYTSLV